MCIWGDAKPCFLETKVTWEAEGRWAFQLPRDTGETWWLEAQGMFEGSSAERRSPPQRSSRRGPSGPAVTALPRSSSCLLSRPTWPSFQLTDERVPHASSCWFIFSVSSCVDLLSVSEVAGGFVYMFLVML